jgi:hypothetical protein
MMACLPKPRVSFIGLLYIAIFDNSFLIYQNIESRKRIHLLSVKTTTSGGGGVWGRRPHAFSEASLALSNT